MGYEPIGNYGLIGNMLACALVSRSGAIDWCCFPRFDAPSIFAAILDAAKGGSFVIRPEGDYESQQEYLPDTNVLQTTFTTATGAVTLTDFMPCYKEGGGHTVRPAEIHRIVACQRGKVTLTARFDPRFDYARADTGLVLTKWGVRAEAAGEQAALSAPVGFTLGNGWAEARFTLRAGEQLAFVLRYGSDKPESELQLHSAAKLEKTARYWKKLAEGCSLIGAWREAVTRSYLTLHLMIYAPTGAIIAAPTTSLPEEIGGERNWDYRFAWLRDASLTVNAFSRLGHGEEAVDFMNWLLLVYKSSVAQAQILYDIRYGEHPVEEILPHLEGYRGSAPVRIGNAAYGQLQLDVFGYILEAAANYADIGIYIGRTDWDLLEKLVNAACELWRQPDNGIWEFRSGPRHFVHSKVMCWVAVDRGIALAGRLGYGGDVARWRKTAGEIKRDILANGWNEQRRAFTQHYGTEALDASNLLMVPYGFLPASDERIIATVDRTAAELGWKGLLRRYQTKEAADGLRGSEGAFLWCSFWLVRNYIRLGRLEEAAELYGKLLGYRNHLGLLSEMVDPDSGEALGNFPQALSHLAVIITGLELAAAQAA